MKRGAWHQCGDRSQKLVQEQLELGVGQGAIISPRDLSLANAIEYAKIYRDFGADVVFDHQFYIPHFTNAKIDSYPMGSHRAAISALNQIGDEALDNISASIEELSRNIGVSAIIAPAIIYQAARDDIVQLNARLFSAARRAGDTLGVPTYSTVVLGQSVTSSDQTLNPMLSQITALAADGWYFAFEFDAERIPSDRMSVERAGGAILTLACTGKPVLHAFAGPLSLASFGFGAAATGIGHSQNTWRFAPERWRPSEGGGGGAAPSRFFSTSLWGTIIYPDETIRLPAPIAQRVMTHSPFSSAVAQNPPQSWDRWTANKHLVHLQCSTADRIGKLPGARTAAREALQVLAESLILHSQIAASGMQLNDNTGAYQANWHLGIENVLAKLSTDYDYLEMIG